MGHKTSHNQSIIKTRDNILNKKVFIENVQKRGKKSETINEKYIIQKINNHGP